MGQLCDGSHGSWVTKDDPFPSLIGLPLDQIIYAREFDIFLGDTIKIGSPPDRPESVVGSRPRPISNSGQIKIGLLPTFVSLHKVGSRPTRTSLSAKVRHMGVIDS